MCVPTYNQRKKTDSREDWTAVINTRLEGFSINRVSRRFNIPSDVKLPSYNVGRYDYAPYANELKM